jgi:hypothetical protein
MLKIFLQVTTFILVTSVDLNVNGFWRSQSFQLIIGLVYLKSSCYSGPWRIAIFRLYHHLSILWLLSKLRL